MLFRSNLCCSSSRDNTVAGDADLSAHSAGGVLLQPATRSNDLHRTASPPGPNPTRARASALGATAPANESGRRAIIQPTVTAPGWIMIGLTEALAIPVRKTSSCQLAAPSCCCTVPGRGHRTGPSGRRANIQSAVTVRGVCPGQDQTHRGTGACGPGVQYTIFTYTIWYA